MMTTKVLLLVLLVGMMAGGSLSAQEPPVVSKPYGKIAATAIIVLTEAYCTARPLGLAMGRLICPGAEEAARKSFDKVIRMETAPKPEETEGHIVLIPRFADMNSAYTQTFLSNLTGAFLLTRPTVAVIPLEKHQMLMLIDWSVSDPSGKVFWTQIVAGYARKTAGLNDQAIKQMVVRDFVANSIDALEKSREVRQFSEGPVEK